MLVAPPGRPRNHLTKPLSKRQLALLRSDCSRSTEHHSRSPESAVGHEGAQESAPGRDWELRLQGFKTDTLRLLHDAGVLPTLRKQRRNRTETLVQGPAVLLEGLRCYRGLDTATACAR